MVRLADLKQRMSPLSTTKPRLHQSTFDLHDLSRKRTVFDKLKRRFSQSEKDLSKLVQDDVSRDLESSLVHQQKYDSSIACSTMSSFDSRANRENETEFGCSTSHEQVRRNSSTLSTFSNMLDLIQSNIVRFSSRMLDSGKATQRTDYTSGDKGLVIANDNEVFGEHSGSFASEMDRNVLLNEGSGEKMATNRVNQMSISGDCYDSDQYGTFNDSTEEEEFTIAEERSRSRPNASENDESKKDPLTCNGSIQNRNSLRNCVSQLEKCESSSLMVETDLDSKGRSLLCKSHTITDGVDHGVVVQSTVATTNCNEYDTAANPTKNLPVEEDETELNLSFCKSQGEKHDQRAGESSINCCSCQLSRTYLQGDSFRLMDCAINKTQEYDISDRLGLRKYGIHQLGHTDNAKAGVCWELRRCNSYESTAERTSGHPRMRLMGSNNDLHNALGQRQKAHDSYDLDDHVEMMKRRQVSMSYKVAVACRERSEKSVVEDGNEPKSRTRRLHSAPNLHCMSEVEKTKLEKIYESTKLNGTSLKSAIRRRSTDSNGNALRVRFDLSKSDEDLATLRSYRQSCASAHDESVDEQVKQIEKGSGDGSKKRWNYVVKKFRINHQLIDLHATDKACVEKENLDKDMENVNIRRDAKKTVEKETEILLESVKEFSLFLPASAEKKVYSEWKQASEDRFCCKAATEMKPR